MLMTTQRHSRASTPVDSRGFSLLEVMVALVVLCVGLLGILKLEAAAISSTTVAAKRSLAALEAASLAASMHVNRGFWANATGAAITVQGTGAAVTAGVPALGTALTAGLGCTPATNGAPCAVADMAAYDLTEWAKALQPLLPNYTAAINCPVAPILSCTVNIVWNEKAVAINAQAAAAQLLNPNATFESPSYTLYVEP
jgi:type IV pilus assembly protein PilV